MVALADNALTTLADLKTQLGISGATEDNELTRIINVASQTLENQIGRKLYYEASISEDLGGYGTPQLALSRTPLVSITSVTFDSTTVPAADYETYSLDAGLIYRPGGWSWTTPTLGNITSDPFPGYERKLYTVVYDGGWVTPQQVGVPTPVRTLPYDLEEAALRIASGIYRMRGRDPSINSERLMSWNVSYNASAITGVAFDAYVRGVIASYQRVSFA